MNKNYSMEELEDLTRREKRLDGKCRYIQRITSYPRHLMKNENMLRLAGVTGMTRIVIEYDNDTGQGWMRVVTEDPVTFATLGCRWECQEYRPNHPTYCTTCDEYKRHRQQLQGHDIRIQETPNRTKESKNEAPEPEAGAHGTSNGKEVKEMLMKRYEEFLEWMQEYQTRHRQ